MIVERAVTAGEYVRADSRVATLVNTDSLRVEITVPEADVALVQAGDAGRLPHRRRRRRQASITARSATSARRCASRAATPIVEAVFSNDDHDLRPGMFVTARLARRRADLPAVPATAVRADGTLRHVFVDVSGRLEDRLVQAGEPLGGEMPDRQRPQGRRAGGRRADPRRARRRAR